MNKVNNRRSMMTEKLLKDGLLQLLEKKELNKITIKELCSVSDVNRSTFYDHYDNLNDLLIAIQDDTIEALRQLKTKLDSLNNKSDIVTIAINHIKDNQYLYNILMTSDGSVEFRNKFAEVIMDFMLSIYPVNMSVSRNKYAIYTLTYGFLCAIGKWMNEDNDFTAEDFADLINNYGYRPISKL